MKIKPLLMTLLIALIAPSDAPSLGIAQEQKKEGHEAHHHKFKYPEFEKFHDILRPIWHDYYPSKEWTKIRSAATDLVKRKDAIMKITFSETTESKAKIEDLRKKFGDSVDELAKIAKSGTDDELKKAVAEMHEAFETLFDAAR